MQFERRTEASAHGAPPPTRLHLSARNILDLQRLVFGTTKTRIFNFDWSRDGKQLACTRGVINSDVVVISSMKAP